MTDVVKRLVGLANSLGGDDEDVIMAGVAEIERLLADVDALSRMLNGLANRSDFADKVLEVRHKADRALEARRVLEPKP